MAMQSFSVFKQHLHGLTKETLHAIQVPLAIYDNTMTIGKTLLFRSTCYLDVAPGQDHSQVVSWHDVLS